MSGGTTLHIESQPKYTLETSEIPNLQKFIEDIKLPFEKSFLQLAFENFELSYQTSNLNLAFLVLMIALESLFNPGLGELKYRISRNLAVLLGNSKEESKNIFTEIGKLYEERSKIIHGGRKYFTTRENLLKLRHCVRESIKEIFRIGKDKKTLLDLLNSRGFGK